MKDLTQTIQSLNRLGLVDVANSLWKIQQLTKVAVIDFSKEIEVFRSIFNIVDFFRGKPLETLTEYFSFPAWSIETASKYIVYSGEDLTNYSKIEVFTIGLPNYLKHFVNSYMENRLHSLSGSDAKNYQQVIEEVKQIRSMLQTGYKNTSDPSLIRKKDVDRILTRISGLYTDMIQFAEIIKNEYTPRLAYRLGYEYYAIDSNWVKTREGPPKKKKKDVEESSAHALLKRLKRKEVEEEKQEEKKEKEPEPIFKDLEDDEEINQLLKEDGYQTKKKDLGSLTALNLKGFTKLGQEFKEEIANHERNLLRELTSLEVNFDEIRETVDKEFADQLDLSLEDFRKEMDLDNLIRIKIYKRASKPEDFLSKFRKQTENYGKKSFEEDIVQVEEYRLIFRRVLRNDVGQIKIVKDEKKDKTRRIIVLYDPDKVKNVWDYHKKWLTSLYRTFVKIAVQSKLTLDTTPIETDSEILKHLEVVLQMLGA